MQHLQPNSSLQGGKYRIEKVLGQGGFGITYLAEHSLLGCKVAIKEFFIKDLSLRKLDEESTIIVSNANSEQSKLLQRYKEKFIKEARTIFQLNHPNIVGVQDVFEENGTAYYVMEYIEGESLEMLVSRQGKLPESIAVPYIVQICDALSFVHSKSIAHLDVKPSNIMIRRDNGQAVLIDFGTSKQYDEDGGETSTTIVGVSHGYAPTEMYSADGAKIFSPQSDIYSVGATLYRLVTGKIPPYAADVVSSGLPAFSSELSSNVCKAINAAMRPKKAERPQSISEFLEILPPIVSVSKETQSVSTQKKLHPDYRNKRFLPYALVAAVVFLLSFGFCLHLINSDSDEKEVENTESEQKEYQKPNSELSQPVYRIETSPSKENMSRSAAELEKTKNVESVESRQLHSDADEFNNAKRRGDYSKIKQLADDGYAPACVVLANYYLNLAKNGDETMYSLADKYAQKAYRAGASGSYSIIETLRNLGYYD